MKIQVASTGSHPCLGLTMHQVLEKYLMFEIILVTVLCDKDLWTKKAEKRKHVGGKNLMLYLQQIIGCCYTEELLLHCCIN